MESGFKSLLKSHDFDYQTPWELVRLKLENEPAFECITLESERVRLFKVRNVIALKAMLCVSCLIPPYYSKSTLRQKLWQKIISWPMYFRNLNCFLNSFESTNFVNADCLSFSIKNYIFLFFLVCLFQKIFHMVQKIFIFHLMCLPGRWCLLHVGRSKNLI